MTPLSVVDTLASSEFYESVDRYSPNESDYIAVVRTLIPDWEMARVNGIWMACEPPTEVSRRRQGWKLHLSASVADARAVIAAAVPILSRRAVPFKFALDERILALMNSKRWVRSGSGKFVTVYPPDDSAFVGLAAELCEATRAWAGPYILSDRRYRDSRVVYYRWGGHYVTDDLNARGEKLQMLTLPSGLEMRDERRAYFLLPPSVRDPFRADAPAAAPLSVLLCDRYEATAALAYTNSGGVYLATDRVTGARVIIKEARPLGAAEYDPPRLLAREYEILRRLAGTGAAPEPLDFFTQWENSFLVEELIPGTPLHNFTARSHPMLREVPTREDAQTFYARFREIFADLAEALRRIHASGFVFSDLSPWNVLVEPGERLRARIIDFDGAVEIGGGDLSRLATQGFSFPGERAGAEPSFAGDMFSLGALMHYFLWPVNQIWAVNPKARVTFVRSVVADVGLPESLGDLTLSLLDGDPRRRPSLDAVVGTLSKSEPVGVPLASVPAAGAAEREADARAIASHILSVANFDRPDRLFPGAGELAHSNPLGVAHGACGVALALRAMLGECPRDVLRWILRHRLTAERYPPGLWVGLSGIAWALLELGCGDEARSALRLAAAHPRLGEGSDLFYGLAGWGMANLRFFAEFRDDENLGAARSAAESIIAGSERGERGICWPVEGRTRLGLAHGSSGIAIFLLNAYLAGGGSDLLEHAIAALDFDLSWADPTIDGRGLSWRLAAGERTPVYPYWRYGSAGVGIAALRFQRVLGGAKYAGVVDAVYHDANRKYSVSPGFLMGLSGLGEFMLDASDLTGEAQFFDSARKIAGGIDLFAVHRAGGLAFPGDGLDRLSCDLGTGSAGVGHFFARLAGASARLPITVDEFLPPASKLGDGGHGRR